LPYYLNEVEIVLIRDLRKLTPNERSIIAGAIHRLSRRALPPSSSSKIVRIHPRPRLTGQG
jgi:hypothetical protein